MAAVIVMICPGTRSAVSAQTHGGSGTADTGTFSFRQGPQCGQIWVVTDQAGVTVQEIAAFPDRKMKPVRA